MERYPKYFGYYLHKDGTPTVVENTDDTIIHELKENNYWKHVRFINDEDNIAKHLKSFNSGFSSKRFNLKPFFP